MFVDNEFSFKAWAYEAVAPGLGVIPAFKGLMEKTLLQKGEKVPSIPYRVVAKELITAAPVVGFTVGGQVLLKKKIQAEVFDGRDDIIATYASSVITGALTSFPLAVINGFFAGNSIVKTWQTYGCKQALAITGREGNFVFGVTGAEPLANLIKSQGIESICVDFFASAFSCGAGSIAGHPFDTYLTRDQAMLTFKWEHKWWGMAKKAQAIAIFAIAYEGVRRLQEAAFEKISS